MRPETRNLAERVAREAGSPEGVVQLMEALRASVEAAGEQAKRQPQRSEPDESEG
jgi:non-homologous end joining protein Ku